ncbi:protein of unknown function [Xenorhabdus nematophila AN6/1]|nr:protein of unknown function [Xenorhabdus nematophila AN6/1]
MHVAQCYRYLGITRQAYYQRCQRAVIKEQQEQDVLRQVQSIRLKQAPYWHEKASVPAQPIKPIKNRQRQAVRFTPDPSFVGQTQTGLPQNDAEPSSFSLSP